MTIDIVITATVATAILRTTRTRRMPPDLPRQLCAAAWAPAPEDRRNPTRAVRQGVAGRVGRPDRTRGSPEDGQTGACVGGTRDNSRAPAAGACQNPGRRICASPP